LVRTRTRTGIMVRVCLRDRSFWGKIRRIECRTIAHGRAKTWVRVSARLECGVWFCFRVSVSV
jgi:hypothetical protein